MNKVNLIGRLTKDIELRKTSNGHSTCTFNIAVDGGKAADGTRRSDFPSIVAWNKPAELCAQYLHKGDRVYIEGKTYTGEYQDQQGVTKRYTEVRREVLELLSSKPQAQPQEQFQQQPQQSYTPQQAPQYQQHAPQSMPQYAPQTQQVGVFGQAPQPAQYDNCPF